MRNKKYVFFTTDLPWKHFDVSLTLFTTTTLEKIIVALLLVFCG